jgi:hypothetical protein
MSTTKYEDDTDCGPLRVLLAGPAASTTKFEDDTKGVHLG